MEKIYIIQPITRENADKYRVLHEEAISLIETAGAAYAGTIYQNIREINAATYVGGGKLYELKERLDGLSDITILFNGELSPSQTLNISASLEDRKVIDRTTLILDIFAKNAKSNEGKLQVELAQLKYLYPRLKGKGAALSRLGGGIGTRGPGETQLETDRRHIRTRLKYLENRLSEMEKRRSIYTERRKKNNLKTVALLGYTNTGKSTLFNTLTNADTYVKNELFATLDPTARKCKIDGVDFLLLDTVGFLQDLPHNLIDAFKSTLESCIHSDLLLIVCDAGADYDLQLKTTLETISEMRSTSPYLIVMNKSDLNGNFSVFPHGSVAVSAKTGKGLELLKQEILARFKNDFLALNLFIPYSEASIYQQIRHYASEQQVEYTDFGQKIHAIVPTCHSDLFKNFINNE